MGPAVYRIGLVEFQFHKVRLKAGKAGGRTYPRCEFQFHKVRLKEAILLMNGGLLMFQFHKVRLKDAAVIAINLGTEVSIP